MDWQKLQTLKEQLLTAEDFGEPLNYFFDLMEEPQWQRCGKPVKGETLKEFIKMIGRMLLHKTVVPVNYLLIEVAEFRFYHGGFMLDGRMGTIFYFKDIDTGLMALTAPGCQPPTEIMRFSITTLKSKQPPATQRSNRTWQ